MLARPVVIARETVVHFGIRGIERRRALVRGRCFRETPVTLVRHGTLIEGVVDLAFEYQGVMTIVDFKTDRAEGDLLDRYRRQVALYAEAVGRVTGTPTRAVLLKV